MIKNTSKNKVLSSKARYVKSLFSKALGLMFKDKVDYGLVFNFYIENNKHHLHTYFMKFNIDVLFLDSNNKVIKIYKNVKPWRSDIYGEGKHIIELQAGKSFNTQMGDKISFK